MIVHLMFSSSCLSVEIRCFHNKEMVEYSIVCGSSETSYIGFISECRGLPETWSQKSLVLKV